MRVVLLAANVHELVVGSVSSASVDVSESLVEASRVGVVLRDAEPDELDVPLAAARLSGIDKGAAHAAVARVRQHVEVIHLDAARQPLCHTRVERAVPADDVHAKGPPEDATR